MTCYTCKALQLHRQDGGLLSTGDSQNLSMEMAQQYLHGTSKKTNFVYKSEKLQGVSEKYFFYF